MATNVSFEKSIVQRLRLAFLFIILIMMVGVFFNSYQLYNLHKTQARVIDFSFPSVSRAHWIEVHLRELVTTIPQLKKTETAQSALEFSRNISDKIAVIRKAITNVSRPGPTANQHDLDDDLVALNEQISNLIPLKFEILQHVDDLATRYSELEEYRQKFRDVIEPLHFDITYTLDSQISSLYDSSKTNMHRGTATENINILSVIQNISSQSSTIIDLGEYLSGSLIEDTNSQIASRIKFLIRAVTLSLVYIKSEDAKKALIPLVKDINQLILGSDGIKEKVSLLRISGNEFVQAEAQSLEIVTRVSRWAHDNVEQALSEIQLSTAQFRRYLVLVIISLLASGILIILLIKYVSHFVIERQINRRMFQLTNSVTKIANNDIEHVVGIHGSDEIALIADALEVFRNNIIELNRSNDELKEFAYAASHDLKSPLRAIGNLAQWIKEDSYDSLPTASKNNLDLLQSRVDRLSRLQSDLLEYSQAGIGEISTEYLNLVEMIEELRELLDPDNNFQITLSSDSSSIYTYVVPLRQVLINLINNAIKHHDQQIGNISVQARYADSSLHISVTDDGPGIDPKYHQTIFKLFKTLKSQDDVEGSGLGLSMVQKIVNRHGGTIFVQSNPEAERGTVFTITWPCVSKARPVLKTHIRK